MAAAPMAFVVSYGKLEEESEEVVAALMDAAEDYLAGAGVTPTLAPASLYNLAVAGIVAHWHENRAAVDDSAPEDFEPGIRLVINQLKRECEVVSILDTACMGA